MCQVLSCICGRASVPLDGTAFRSTYTRMLLAGGLQDLAGANDAELTVLKRRKLVVLESWKTYRVGKGPAFALQRKKAATELTTEMLQK